MKKNYSFYTAEELLNDDFFLECEKSPTPDRCVFWERLMEEYPALAQEVRLARLVLHGIRLYANYEEIPSDRIQQMKDQIDMLNRQQSHRKQTLRILYASVAAAAILIGGIFLWDAKDTVTDAPEYNYEQMAQSFDDQMDGATDQIRLMLSHDQELLIDGKEADIDYSQQGEIRVSGNAGKTTTQKEDSVRFNQLFVPKGKRSFVTLADGTKIWVNSDSRLIYPESFVGNKREVYVEGEIYLDVTHDENRPFMVKTSAMEVIVLGTQFDISAYKNEPEQYVVLVDGKVEVSLPDQRKAIMEPEQKLSVEDSKVQVRQVDVYDFVGWKDGYYQFRERKLSVVFDKLSQFYGVDFSYSEQIKALTCSGKLNLSDDIQDVLKTLQRAAPIQISYHEKDIYIDVKP